jgi:hypothetical protein
VKFGWLLAISAICAALVIAAVLMRTAAGWPSRRGIRLTAILACAAVPAGLIAWLPSGPLAKDWAKRAGTPSYLLASSTRATSAARAANAGGPPSFTAQVTGTVRQGESADGLQVVDLSMTADGQRLNALDIRIIGQALGGGGVQLTRSRVTLGSSADPAQYSGRVTSLRGTDLGARLRNSSGAVVQLAARLQLDPSGSIGGTVRVSPASG